MANYSTHDIHNIALVGHAGSGKTSLIESLLHRSGMIKTKGTIERGDTVCDSDDLEKELQHSLDIAITHLSHENKQINIIDTPGYADFLGRGISILPAVESAMVVVNASTGIEPVTIRMMDAAKRRNLCRFIIINKIDSEEVDHEALLESLKETFGKECLPINLPAENGKKVIDCYFQPGGDATDISSVSQAHDNLVDQVVEVDEELMELYLEQGQAIEPEQLHDPFEKALREGHLIPVCFTSAENGAGIDELLNLFSKLMPDPTEGNPPPFMKGEGADMQPVEVTPDESKHVIGHVFKVINDPYRGKLGIFRIHQGKLEVNSQLYIGDARKPFKVNHLYRLQGKEQEEMKQAVPGDICAVARIDDIHFDAVIHDSHDEDHHHLRSIECPLPLFGLAITTSKRGDEQKLSDALHKLEDEDPCFHVEHNVSLNETVMRGLGELHLDVLLQQIKNKYSVEVETHPPSIAYRETITRKAEGHYRHKKQTGGAGQFGEVFLRIEPLERGSGFEYVNAVVGGAIPGQFIPAVEKGVRSAMEEGAISGFTMQDIRVTVYDGKFHSVDSKEIAFVTAGKKAFLEAVDNAGPVILEPIVNISITTSDSFMGDLTGDLAGRRGQISGTETGRNNTLVIKGQAPLAELEGYSTQLKAMTGGEGSYTIEFSHYEAVPPNIQRQLSSAKQA
ncbi:MAG: elongation factor G [gamma proteobacterium symbiont of Stewartia floridana]|nr:elongation factor G [Candidatus Thiodiazotropha taylori]RLW56708.1 MAG: elongation factor G [gamma proteobacterium symbiont of Stewartia floridana]RLW60707.1 MAG: elongation factor G [gamma proteobacterium symbiont of Stewartia floridana]RLW63526.1 MAG: elongation factor G [gamma proteobacterium symbiont of Stewartia floridana]RLW67368.1 MAG: elongation factor G [gamma proteobacterium symbiont of Stewartia floridana]